MIVVSLRISGCQRRKGTIDDKLLFACRLVRNSSKRSQVDSPLAFLTNTFVSAAA